MLNVRISGGKLKGGPVHLKMASFHTYCSSPSSLGIEEATYKKENVGQPRLHHLNPGKIQTKWSTTNPKSIPSYSTYDTPLMSGLKLITNRPIMAGSLVSQSKKQKTNTPRPRLSSFQEGRDVLRNNQGSGLIKARRKTTKKGRKKRRKKERGRMKKQREREKPEAFQGFPSELQQGNFNYPFQQVVDPTNQTQKTKRNKDQKNKNRGSRRGNTKSKRRKHHKPKRRTIREKQKQKQKGRMQHLPTNASSPST